MDPKSKQFLVFSALLLATLVGYMLYRPKRRPSRLKLRQTGNQSKANLDNDHLNEAEPQFEEGPTPERAREINIVFQFNGHSFEAYEVLGLPAGSPIEEVQKAYDKAISDADEESLEFLGLAFKSIQKSLS